MDRLDGQVALVSGSTSGIGEQVARDLAQAGAHLVVNSSSSVEAGRTLADSLPTESIYVQADISQEEQSKAMVAATIEKFGRLDILVNNAGWTTRVPHTDMEALSNEILFKTFEVNVYGTWWLSRAAMPHLERAEQGCIVNVSSVAGVRAIGSSTAYGMAKAAMNNLTLDLARNFRSVRVNAVAPGLVATPWTADWDDLHQGVAAMIPAGRSATPVDVSKAILACIDNQYVTGQVFVVDGGTTIVM
ncbi:MAG: polyketide synthase [Spirochaeta sp.]|nr:polyketide synthase [Spirochaeta sp.]RPG06711.1 MAG: SDR family oxidoreductase [Proteobacteria bacterium TMED72]